MSKEIKGSRRASRSHGYTSDDEDDSVYARQRCLPKIGFLHSKRVTQSPKKSDRVSKMDKNPNRYSPSRKGDREKKRTGRGDEKYKTKTKKSRKGSDSSDGDRKSPYPRKSRSPDVYRSLSRPRSPTNRNKYCEDHCVYKNATRPVSPSCIPADILPSQSPCATDDVSTQYPCDQPPPPPPPLNFCVQIPEKPTVDATGQATITVLPHNQRTQAPSFHDATFSTFGSPATHRRKVAERPYSDYSTNLDSNRNSESYASGVDAYQLLQKLSTLEKQPEPTSRGSLPELNNTEMFLHCGQKHLGACKKKKKCQSTCVLASKWSTPVRSYPSPERNVIREELEPYDQRPVKDGGESKIDVSGSPRAPRVASQRQVIIADYGPSGELEAAYIPTQYRELSAPNDPRGASPPREGIALQYDPREPEGAYRHQQFKEVPITGSQGPRTPRQQSPAREGIPMQYEPSEPVGAYRYPHFKEVPTPDSGVRTPRRRRRPVREKSVSMQYPPREPEAAYPPTQFSEGPPPRDHPGYYRPSDVVPYYPRVRYRSEGYRANPPAVRRRSSLRGQTASRERTNVRYRDEQHDPQYRYAVKQHPYAESPPEYEDRRYRMRRSRSKVAKLLQPVETPRVEYDQQSSQTSPRTQIVKESQQATDYEVQPSRTAESKSTTQIGKEWATEPTHQVTEYQSARRPSSPEIGIVRQTVDPQQVTEYEVKPTRTAESKSKTQIVKEWPTGPRQQVTEHQAPRTQDKKQIVGGWQPPANDQGVLVKPCCDLPECVRTMGPISNRRHKSPRRNTYTISGAQTRKEKDKCCDCSCSTCGACPWSRCRRRKKARYKNIERYPQYYESQYPYPMAGAYSGDPGAITYYSGKGGEYNPCCGNTCCAGTCCGNTTCGNACCDNACCKPACCDNACCDNACCDNACCKAACCDTACCGTACCDNSCCDNSCCENECCENMCCGGQNPNSAESILGLAEVTDGTRIWRMLLAEFLGTFLLVFIGCGSILTFSEDPPILLIGLTFGLLVGTIVQCIAHISGGHINPAVTISFFVVCEIKLIRTLLYIVAQLLGAAAGAGILKLCTPDKFEGNLGITNVTAVEPEQGFGYEVILTFLLVFVIHAVCDPRRKDVKGSAPLAIGLAVVVCHLSGIKYSGSSLNPARSFGPALVANIWANHWVYWAGPILGAILAAVIYKFLFKVRKSDDESYDF